MNGTVKKHTLILDDRSELSVTGVSDMIGFDEELVVLDISGRRLQISGSGLCVTKLSLENGEADIKGVIDMIAYDEEETKKQPVFSRLFGRQ